MKNRLIIFSVVIASAGIFASCNNEHAAGNAAAKDSTGNYAATNPYRDTFATTSTYGNASTVDNSGSGGTHVAKADPAITTVPSRMPAPAAPAAPVAVADTAAKK